MHNPSTRRRSIQRRPRRAALLVFSMLAAFVAVAQPVTAQDNARTSCAGQAASLVGQTPGEILGTDGDDVIVGTPRADMIIAGAGNDVV